MSTNFQQRLHRSVIRGPITLWTAGGMIETFQDVYSITYWEHFDQTKPTATREPAYHLFSVRPVILEFSDPKKERRPVFNVVKIEREKK